jgi:hypothetical protein
MNSPLMIQVRADGAPCSNLMEIGEAPRSLRKAPRENGASGSHPPDGPGTRFAFLIHPLSEQTRELMALDEDGRLRNTWGRADLFRCCAEAHAAFAARPRPMRDGPRQGPRVVDTIAGLAEHVAERRGRHINPVLIGVGGPTGLTRTFVRGEGAETAPASFAWASRRSPATARPSAPSGATA